MRVARILRVLQVGALAAGCSSTGSGGGSADGGVTSGAQGVIGAACDATHLCQSGLFCYESVDTPELDGLCTTNCTAGVDTDSCILKYPNTHCLVADVCGASCGNGLACPFGSTCDVSYEVCVAGSSVTPDSCQYAFDGQCDEPSLCTPGTDTTDCSGASNSCQYAFDGQCDEPSLCAPGTDTADCQI